MTDEKAPEATTEEQTPPKKRKVINFNTALVLQALVDGHAYGFEVMKVADLPSGTIYPLLRRLEASGLVNSSWEEKDLAHADGRPVRRYYEASEEGKLALAAAREKIAARQAAVFGDLNAAGDGATAS